MDCAVIIVIIFKTAQIFYYVHHRPAMPPPKDRLSASPGGFDPSANANANADADANANANLARVRQTSFLSPILLTSPLSANHHLHPRHFKN